MKHFYGRFPKNLKAVAFAAIVTLGQAAHSQTFKEYDITPQLSKRVIESRELDFYVYPVALKEVEYHKLETIQVESKEHKYAREAIEKYQKDYDRYNEGVQKSVQRQEALDKIVADLEGFLNSKEKYKEKEKSLTDAQDIADKNEIEGIVAWHKKVNQANSNGDVVLSLVKGSRISDEEVSKYRERVQRLTIDKPQETYGYSEYVKYSEELKTVPQTEEGTGTSKEISRRKAYVVQTEPVDISTLNGKFVVMPGYRLVKQDLPEKFVKYELTDDSKGISGDEKIGDPFPMIRKQGSDEYYYVMSEDFLPYLHKEQASIELSAMVKRLGYKEYKDEYGEARIKSKTCEISLDDRTYAELKSDPAYISKLDADQQKIASLVQQTPAHSKTLDGYLSIYNVKHSRMSAADLKAWRAATASAQKLHSQIYAISQKYDGNTSFTLLNKSRTFDNFLDNLLASKGVLGM